MLVTEEEAKTKWCPEVRTGLTAGMAVNRHIADAPGAKDGVYDETRCIGSACMAWRWHAWTAYVPSAEPEAHFVAEARVSFTHGFCGKAGAPKGYGDPANPE